MIETERLRLREFTDADAPALYALYQDAATMRFMGPPPASLEEEIENIRAHRSRYYEARGYGLWGVELRETGAMVGRCGLLDTTIDGRAEVELSYLLDPAYLGRGLATEAARAVLDFAAAALGLNRVVAVIDPLNIASRRVAERLGMRREGTTIYKSFGEVELYVWQR
jgi:RimJ/RimL family protein N-acetyltransferase